MATPATFGRFQVERPLGRGAMGIVYLAEDPLLGRQVAIKAIQAHPQLQEHELEELRKRFEGEARSAANLSHPNLVTIFDVGQEQDTFFIAMEYVRGEGLDAVLSSDRVLSFKEIADLALQICSALDYAHERGIIHRDIKPANIMITRSGRPKVTDFGVAKQATSTLTRTGTTLGTPAYMSPEQITGHQVTGASDQFSMAIMLYEMLTGRLPFEGDQPTTVMYRIVHEQPPRPAEISDRLPGAIDAVLMRGLAKDPAARYPTCTDLAEAARAALGAAPADAGVVLGTTVSSQPDVITSTLPALRTDHAEDRAEAGPLSVRTTGPEDVTVVGPTPRHGAVTDLPASPGAGPGSPRTLAPWLRSLSSPGVLATLAGGVIVLGLAAWGFWGGQPAEPGASGPTGSATMVGADTDGTPVDFVGPPLPDSLVAGPSDSIERQSLDGGSTGGSRSSAEPADPQPAPSVGTEPSATGEPPPSEQSSSTQESSIPAEQPSTSGDAPSTPAQQDPTPAEGSTTPSEEPSTSLEQLRPIRVGGDVQPPVAVHEETPDFPDWAAAQGLPTYVIVELVVGPSGAVHDAKVLRGAHPDLEALAIEAAYKWTFEPATRNGEPVAVYHNIAVRFKE